VAALAAGAPAAAEAIATKFAGVAPKHISPNAQQLLHQLAPRGAGAAMNVRVGSNDGPSYTEHRRTIRTHLPHVELDRGPAAQAAESGAAAGAAVKALASNEGTFKDFLALFDCQKVETSIEGHRFLNMYDIASHKHAEELQAAMFNRIMPSSYTMTEYLTMNWTQHNLEVIPADPDCAMFVAYYGSFDSPVMMRLQMTTELLATKNLSEFRAKYTYALREQCNATEKISELCKELSEAREASSMTSAWISQVNADAELLVELKEKNSEQQEALETLQEKLSISQVEVHELQEKYHAGNFKQFSIRMLHSKEKAKQNAEKLKLERDIAMLKEQNADLVGMVRKWSTSSAIERENDICAQLKKNKTALAEASLATSALTVVVHRQNGIIEAAREAAECVICMAEPKTTALNPCGHRVVCSTCATNLHQCPLCRAAVTSTLRVFG